MHYISSSSLCTVRSANRIHFFSHFLDFPRNGSNDVQEPVRPESYRPQLAVEIGDHIQYTQIPRQNDAPCRSRFTTHLKYKSIHTCSVCAGVSASLSPYFRHCSVDSFARR